MGWGLDDLLGIPTLGGYTAMKHYVIPKVYKSLYEDPANQKKAGLDQLTTGLQGLANDQRDFQLEGNMMAQKKYQRANDVNQALYGDPASLSVAKYTGK